MQIGRRRRQTKSVPLLVVLSLIMLAASARAQSTAAAQYVGSQRCEHCHAAQYAGWKQTRMANVVRDPAAHPDAVLGDFTHADPARTFDLKQVAFAAVCQVAGSRPIQNEIQVVPTTDARALRASSLSSGWFHAGPIS